MHTLGFLNSFLKKKSEAFHVVLQFIANAEKITNCQVKAMQTDGRMELDHSKNIFRKEE